MKLRKVLDKSITLIKEKSKMFQTTILGIVGFIGIYSWIFPFNEDFLGVSIKKIGFSILSYLCGISFLLFLIVSVLKSGKENNKSYRDLLYIFPVVYIQIISILMFFSNTLWGYKSVAIGFSFVFMLFVELFFSIKTLLNKTFCNENTPVIIIVVAILSLLLAGVNELSGNNGPAYLCYKVSLGFIYMISISLYTNRYIYKLNNSQKRISRIIGIIFWGSLITISFPFYVQWCGLSGDNFETFVTVYAAVLGGGITLAGVAWTIKDGNDKRKEDLDRIELERKEEERKKYIPYIRLANEVQAHYAGRVNSVKHLNFDNPNEISSIENNTYYAIMINPFTVKNVSESNIILKGIYLDNVYHPFDSEVLVERDSVGQIQFPLNHRYDFAKKISSVVLIITDIIGNKYAVSCDCYKRLDEQPVKSLAPDNQEYTVLSYTYTVESIALPKLIEED